jgi:hypothetical protein
MHMIVPSGPEPYQAFGSHSSTHSFKKMASYQRLVLSASRLCTIRYHYGPSLPISHLTLAGVCKIAR